MTTPKPLKRSGDPFALDATEFPFSDALIIQTIASPTHLQATDPGRRDTGGGGFFIEAEGPPLEQFEQSTLITGSGKRVAGFAAATLLFFPVALRLRWEAGEPGSRIPVSQYVEGARSRTTVLAVLDTSQWIKLTAGGLASKSLSTAWREHMFAQAKLQRQPFAAALSGVAGTAKQVKGTMVTPFQFVTLQDENCSDALGWQIRDRWEEVLAWRGASDSSSKASSRAPSGNPPEQPGGGEHQAAPPPPAKNGSSANAAPVYGNGKPIAENQAEAAAFQAFVHATGKPPTDREALRAWYRTVGSGQVERR